jgi:hypothetical protein
MPMETLRFYKNGHFSPLIRLMRHAILAMYGDDVAEGAARSYLAETAHDPMYEVVRGFRQVVQGRLEGREWSRRVHPYLVGYHAEGVPFLNFERDPGPISQIKKIVNALYHTECALLVVEAIDVDHLLVGTTENSTVSTLLTVPIQSTLEHVYELCRLMTHPDVDLNAAFAPEWAVLMPLLNQFSSNILAYSADANAFLAEHQIDLSNPTGIIHQAGVLSGMALNQLRPGQKKRDYQRITEFSAELPAYIEQMTSYIREFSTEAVEYGPGINREKLNELEGAAIRLLHSIEGLRTGGPLGLLLPLNALNYVHITRHIYTLGKSIVEEMGNLSVASQDFICSQLRELKYKLAEIVAVADKVEEELMMDNGVLSYALMRHMEPFYEGLVYLVEDFVDFTEKGPELKILQDVSFTDRRLETTYLRQAERESDQWLLEEQIPVIHAFFNALESHRERRLSELSQEVKFELIALYRVVQPYVAQLDVALSNQIIRGLHAAIPDAPGEWSRVLTFVNQLTNHAFDSYVADYPDQVARFLRFRPRLMDALEKQKATYQFRRQLNEDLIQYVYDSMDELNLYPMKSKKDSFAVDESVVLGSSGPFLSATNHSWMQPLTSESALMEKFFRGLTREQARMMSQLHEVRLEKWRQSTKEAGAAREFLALLLNEAREKPIHQLVGQHEELRQLYHVFQPIMVRALMDDFLFSGFSNALWNALSGKHQENRSTTVGQYRDVHVKIEALIHHEAEALRESVSSNALHLNQLYISERAKIVRSKQACQALLSALEGVAPEVQMSQVITPTLSRNGMRTLYGLIQPILNALTIEHGHPRDATFDQSMIDALLGRSHVTLTVEQARVVLLWAEPHYVRKEQRIASKRAVIEVVARRALTVEREQRPLALDAQGEERSTFLVKKPIYTPSIVKLRKTCREFINLFNDEITGALNRRMTGVPFPELENEQVVLREPTQILMIKRLENCLHYIENAAAQLEQLDNYLEEPCTAMARLNNQRRKGAYVIGVFNIQRDVRAAVWLLMELKNDPEVTRLMHGIVRSFDETIKTLNAFGRPYAPLQSAKGLDTVSRDTVFYVVNGLMILPQQIDALRTAVPCTSASMINTHDYAERVSLDIRRIVANSDYYFKLFLETPTAIRLFRELSKKLKTFTATTYLAVRDHLASMNHEHFARLLIEADQFEDALRLKEPGLITRSLKQIVDAYYQGLLEPLGLKAAEHIALATSTLPMNKRIKAAQRRITDKAVRLENLVNKKKSVDLLLNKLNSPTAANAVEAASPTVRESFHALIPQLREANAVCQTANAVIGSELEREALLNRSSTLIREEPSTRERALIHGYASVYQAHLEGLIGTQRLSLNAGKEKKKHLEEQMCAQLDSNHLFINKYIQKSLSLDHSLEMYTGVYRGLIHCGHVYDQALLAYIKRIEPEIIVTIKNADHMEETIKQVLAEKVSIFEKEQLHDYRQLERFQMALSELNNYLRTQSDGLKPGCQTWAFESHETLTKKRKLVSELEKIVFKEGVSIRERMEQLDIELRRPRFKYTLLAYHHYQAPTFLWLVQCVVALLEFLHVYRSERHKVYDALFISVKKASSVEESAIKKWNFFSGVVRQEKPEFAEPKPLTMTAGA